MHNTKPRPLRVVLVDDSAGLRAALKNFFGQKKENVVIVGDGENGQQALSLVAQWRPDVLLLDEEMPGMKGHEVVQALRAQGNQVPVLAMSSYDDLYRIEQMLACGAQGYITKYEITQFLPLALRAVAALPEETWLSPNISTRLENYRLSKKAQSIQNRT